MAKPTEAVIEGIRPDSPAACAGLRPGDRLLAIGGAPVRDQIDYRFQCAEERLAIQAARGDAVLTFTVDKDADEDLGLEFAAATFDGVRRCRNRCLFCFVDRLPKGLRPSLYVKDDDYRYSFLFGSYVTLSNLSEEDWRRIQTQRLSPLYVSVHATDLELRRRLLGNPKAPDIRQQLRRLSAARITVHAQIVLCPGLNDGPALAQTVADLAQLADCVRSVAIVPVGLTRFGPPDGPRRPTVSEMAAVVRQASRWQREFRRRLGRTFVYPSDEFYLGTGAVVPSAPSYDGYPQYENGVGMARVLLDEWSQVRRRLERGVTSRAKLDVVCGELAESCLRPVIGELSALTQVEAHLHIIPNRFFGPQVTVTGLLAASDVISELAGKPLGGMVVLPRTMFDSQGALTLDGLDSQAIQEALGAPVAVADSVRELAELAIGNRGGAGSGRPSLRR